MFKIFTRCSDAGNSDMNGSEFYSKKNRTSFAFIWIHFSSAWCNVLKTKKKIFIW